MTIKLNHDEQQLVNRGKESLAFIRSDVSFQHWLDYGVAMYVGARALQRQEGLNKRQGARWVKHWGPWLRENGFDKIEVAVRSRLQTVIDNLDAIQEWRATLTDSQRQRLNHPVSVLRAWKAATQPPKTKAPPKTKTTPSAEPLEPIVTEPLEPIVAEPPPSATERLREPPPQGAFLEPIVVGELPPKIGMTDEKKAKGRELVEKVFHPGNTVGEAIAFIRAYHRTVGAWSPSDLDIGSYEAQIDNMRERTVNARDNIVNTISENFELGKRVRELETQLADQTRDHNTRVRGLETEIKQLKSRK